MIEYREVINIALKIIIDITDRFFRLRESFQRFRANAPRWFACK